MTETAKKTNRAAAPPRSPAPPAVAEEELAPAETDRVRWAMLILTLVGIGVATYLTYVHYANIPVVCGGIGNCESVSKGPYSEIAHIPVSTFGLLAYLVLGGLLLFEERSELLQDYGPLGVFALALLGVVFSAYLTYLELYVIHAICPWCVASAIAMTLIFILSIVRLRRSMS